MAFNEPVSVIFFDVDLIVKVIKLNHTKNTGRSVYIIL